jgi:hypothetical protein
MRFRELIGSVRRSPADRDQTTKNYPEDQARVVDSHFDREYYLRQNPDVAEAGVDPLEHFMQYGWHEGRDPHPSFSTREYLELNPDVAEAKVNPYWHYIIAGRAEGRLARIPSSSKLEVLRNLKTLPQQIQDWKRAESAPPHILSADDVLATLPISSSAETQSIILSFSHDNYRDAVGGVQFCLNVEQKVANDSKMTYLNVHPWQPLPILSPKDSDPFQTLILDGNPVGTCRMSTLIEAIARVSGKGAQVHTVIHSLLGHSPERVVELVLAAGRDECWFWLHDYFSMCPGYTLLRNTISYCGAPDPESLSCSICCFGSERKSHISRFSSFFSRIGVNLVAPSEFTRDLWLEKSGLPYASIAVAPHLSLEWQPSQSGKHSSEDGPIRIGFIGAPTPQKGWDVFCRIHKRFRNDGDLEFFYFGQSSNTQGIECVQVHSGRSGIQALIDSIAAKEIDIVIHWGSGPETFSLSTHEAMAGGAFVITNPNSGNVAKVVQELDRGVVLESEEDLFSFLESSELRELVNECRRRRSTASVNVRLSGMTVPLLNVVGKED